MKKRIAIISTPRSGNTWLRRLLSDIYSLEEIGEHKFNDFYIPKKDNLIIQIHWPYNKRILEVLKKNNFKILSLSRHPLDILISILRFSRFSLGFNRWLGGLKDINKITFLNPYDKEFVDYALGDEINQLFEVSGSWWQQDDVIKVSYEDLNNDPVKVLKDIIKKLDYPDRIPQKKLESVVSQNSLIKFSKMITRHGWKGMNNNWQNFFLKNDAKKIFNKYKKLSQNDHYEFEDNYKLTHKNAAKNWKQAFYDKKGDADVFISYANHLEDVLINYALKDIVTGFYAEIGANDPISGSITKAFYEKGWQGLNIIFNKNFYQKFKIDRERDTNLNSISELNLDKELFAHKSNIIHFLRMNIKQDNKQFFKKISLKKNRPWIILINADAPPSIEKKIISNTYELVYSNEFSKFFVSSEHKNLKKYFANITLVLGNFIPKSVLESHQESYNNSDQLKILEEKNNRLLNQNKLIEKEKYDLIEYNRSLKNIIRNVELSLSWKLTKPLRVLRNLFKNT